MAHVLRRIHVQLKNDPPKEYSEADFVEVDAPLILLGEPGSGKSDTAKHLRDIADGVLTYADVLTSNSPLKSVEKSKLLVIDGLDEVLANGAKEPISVVLNRMLELDHSRFVLTCRSMDWSNATNEQAIIRRFSTQPVVGHLQPLSEQEIIQMVELVTRGDVKGEEFVREAKDRDALELAQNPQSLTMLLEAIREGGWPPNKAKLFENACLQLGRDISEIHKSLNPNRPAIDRILTAAGFLFSQLLLSGKRGVNVDGQEDILFPRPIELVGMEFTELEIRAAIGSRLMRASGTNTLEPCHRSVAEYLAARWLIFALKNGLSLGRFESIMYAAGTRTVPTSLRGVHAWMATLDRSITDSLVTADPYGCLRYGDVTEYSDNQIRHLLRELQALSQIDPYFRSDDWHFDIGKGLARISVQADILKLIKNPDISYQLTTVVLQSIRKTPVATAIRGDLTALVLDDHETYVERDRALDAVFDDASPSELKTLVKRLIKNLSVDSSRLALELLSEKVQIFSGKEIADTLVAYETASHLNSESSIVGVAFRLAESMSLSQLRDALDQLSSAMTFVRHQQTDRDRAIEERLFECLENFLSKGGEAAAGDLWRWIKKAEGHSFRDNEWKKYSAGYFDARPDLRRAIQELALQSAQNAEEAWMVGFDLNSKAAGLWIREDDLVFHLERMLISECRLRDWVARWSKLVRWAQINQDYVGSALGVARLQAQTNTELAAVLVELDRPPKRDWEEEHKKREAEEAIRRRNENKARHKVFENIRLDVEAGKHLGALYDISRTYLGWNNHRSSDLGPIQRLAELVGQSNVDSAIEGLRAAKSRTDFPTVKNAAQLRVKEKKHYLLEAIAAACCSLHVAEGGQLKTLPNPLVDCAFFALEWGLYRNVDPETNELEKSLEEVVSDSPERLERFLRDSVEPALEAGEESVTGLYQITHEKRFADLAGILSLDWLTRFPKLSTSALGYLLGAATIHSSRTRLVALIETKITNSDWGSDQHRAIWLGAAFATDFQTFKGVVTAFAKEGGQHLWALQEAYYPDNDSTSKPQPMDVERLVFLVENFAQLFPPKEPPKSGWGGHSDYEGSQFIFQCISRLGENTGDEANGELSRLIESEILGGYASHAKHVLALQKRQRAEINWGSRGLADVRNVLMAGPPGSIDDLQALVMDELGRLQRRVKDGPTNGIEPFWDGAKPHTETYCRDRIVEHLDPFLNRFGIRVHTEGTMPDSQRCDFLCTYGEMDFPVEIKGQWHPKVWSAACDQLEDNYSREYRADGRGAYVVVWFGKVPRYNPPQLGGSAQPKNANDMLSLLSKLAPRPISPKTKLFVMDVSKPAKSPKKKKPVKKAKKSTKRPKPRKR